MGHRLFGKPRSRLLRTDCVLTMTIDRLVIEFISRVEGDTDPTGRSHLPVQVSCTFPRLIYLILLANLHCRRKD
jgi:hypothetical protein